MKHRVAFDVDGTVLLPKEGVRLDYNDHGILRRGVVPCPVIAPYVRALLDVGADVVYVTGRGQHVQDVTTECLEAHDLGGTVVCAPHRGHYPGDASIARWKAWALMTLEPTFYAGDHELDHHAAHVAGVPYYDAQDLRRELRAGRRTVVA